MLQPFSLVGDCWNDKFDLFPGYQGKGSHYTWCKPISGCQWGCRGLWDGSRAGKQVSQSFLFCFIEGSRNSFLASFLAFFLAFFSRVQESLKPIRPLKGNLGLVIKKYVPNNFVFTVFLMMILKGQIFRKVNDIIIALTFC